MKKYVALIIDLKESRKYRDRMRSDIQEYLMQVVENLNHIFEESLERIVDFSAGDEVQGLFSSVRAAYLYFRMFSMLVAPVEVRAGIGVGTWDVVVKGAGTTAQDGRAYHNARYAIQAVEESKGYSVLMCSEHPRDIVVNSLFNTTAMIISKQSSYQNEIMLLSELLYPINNSDIINTFKLEKLIEILRFKNEFIRFEPHFVSYSMKGRQRESVFCKLSHLDIEIESKPVSVVFDSSSFFVEEGRVKGLSKQLAELIGVSRQSIEKTIKLGMIYEERNLAITTLSYLAEMEV